MENSPKIKIDFEKRLKENRQRTVQHGRSDSNFHCRNCGENDFTGDCLAKAKRHAVKTGHTVDVYYETHREVTYYDKNNSCIAK